MSTEKLQTMLIDLENREHETYIEMSMYHPIQPYSSSTIRKKTFKNTSDDVVECKSDPLDRITRENMLFVAVMISPPLYPMI